MAAVRHKKVSAVADSGDTNLVQPSDWNDDHTGGSGTAEVDFGTGRGSTLASVVVAATWVEAGTVFTFSPGGATADHSEEETMLEGITAVATEIDPGVGFTLVAHAPSETTGRHNINFVGV